MAEAIRCVILPPVPVPYREPLFARLAKRSCLEPTVVYQSSRQPGWDQRPDWFPERHDYHSVVLRSWQRPRVGRTPIVVPRRLGRTLSELDPDCVVSWEYGPATLRSLAWCRRRRRPLLIFSELTRASARELSSLQRRLHGLLAPRAAGFVAASSGARERLLAMGVASERIEVSLQSADVDRFRPRDGRSARDGPVRILFVGRLVRDKNVDGLLEAFADAGLREGEAELEVCGTGPLEGELRELASRLGAPVRFLGYVEPAALPELYAGADVLALVSTYEPFGVAVREAVAAGLPILCSRTVGAVGDLARDRENALLVDPLDRAEVSAALRRLVREHRLRERLAAGSRALADATPPDADVEAFERAVLNAVGRTSTRDGADASRFPAL